jgi:hypothetical protein
MSILQLLALMLIWMPSHAASGAWPKVKPFTQSFPVDLMSERIVIDVPITDQGGAVVYHFACRGGNVAYLDSLRDNWVGPLMCTLAMGDQAREESLLDEDDGPAWYGRGQFRGEELAGDCANYPEFGVHRSFRLRGFRLSLDAQDVVVDRSGLARSFTLAVSLVDDAGATLSQAERPGFLDPRGKDRTCASVIRGREPRMCRDWQAGGSWAACKE